MKRNLDEELSEKERMKTLGVILESMFSSLVEARSVAESSKAEKCEGRQQQREFRSFLCFFLFRFFASLLECSSSRLLIGSGTSLEKIPSFLRTLLTPFTLMVQRSTGPPPASTSCRASYATKAMNILGFAKANSALYLIRLVNSFSLSSENY